MSNKVTLTWFGIVVLVVCVSACTAVAQPTPILQMMLTKTVEPLSAPIPDSIVTPAIKEAAETINSTATEPSNFPQSPTLTPTATPIPGISPPILSSLGQLAYIQDQILYVQSETGLNEFQAIDSFVKTAIWSPDGSKLLYTSNSIPGYGISANDHRIWLSNENVKLSLTELIADFPTPPYAYPASYSQTDYIKWLPDSNRILFFGLIPYKGEHAEYFATISLVDLEERSIALLNDQFDRQRDRILSVTDTHFLIITHCGAPCKLIEAYDYTGQSIWGEPWGTAAELFMVSPDKNFIIDTGYNGQLSAASIAEIDIASGNFNVIWKARNSSGDEYFRFIPPQISPDNNFISFHWGPGGNYQHYDPGVLNIIGRDGHVYGQLENSLVLDWRPTGGLVAAQSLNDGTNQLIYWPLDRTEKRAFVTPSNFTFLDGKWSPDGQYFVYNALDESIEASYLYLWQPAIGSLNLIHGTASSEKAFNNLAWLPDSSAFYFSLSNQELWQFKIGVAEPNLIAASRK